MKSMNDDLFTVPFFIVVLNGNRYAGKLSVVLCKIGIVPCFSGRFFVVFFIFPLINANMYFGIGFILFIFIFKTPV